MQWSAHYHIKTPRGEQDLNEKSKKCNQSEEGEVDDRSSRIDSQWYQAKSPQRWTQT